MNDDIDTTPIDLRPLDPTRDTDRFSDVVSSITRAAMTAGASNHSVPLFDADGVFDRLDRWWPATLAAAAVIIAVSIPELTAPNRPAPASALDVLGIPTAITQVLAARQTPSLADLSDALKTSPGQ